MHDGTGSQFEDFQRMYGDPGRKKRTCIIYSDDRHKIQWDIFIIFLLVVVCTIIPWRLAFSEDTPAWTAAYYAMDFFFLIDMILTFFTTIPSTEYMSEEYDHKVLARIYLQGWFTIDLLSIIPFDSLLKLWKTQGGPSNVNVILRVSRFSKIYKLIRLMRLIKIFKVLKNKSNLTAQFSQSMSINSG
jgi:potassium voltage-gated channel Eag-related subfamily H protein 7